MVKIYGLSGTCMKYSATKTTFIIIDIFFKVPLLSRLYILKW